MKPAAPGYESESLRRFAEVLKGRRTVELFLQTAIPDKLIKEALEVATWAPNHHVTEPWRFYLLGPASISRCLDLCEELVSAKKGAAAGVFKRKRWSEKPGWLVVTCATSDDARRQLEDYAATAAGVQNLLLYLWKAGIGTKWTTGAITREPRFAEILGIDFTTEFVVGLIWFGYPKLTPTQYRKALREVLTELP
ncbi:MAG TPA: nitroreductase [Woeseiaceae bacterium]|nr:nitroreductase [Woeseiaceae bacterium]